MTERSFRFGVTMFSVGEDLGRMIKSLLQHNVHPTLWVRRSTGMLSIELLLSESSPRGPQVPKFVFELSSSPDMAEMILGSADPDTMASRGLSLPQYHGICNTGFPSYRHASVSPSATVTLAGVTSRAKEFENPRPLTWVRDADICSRSGWCSHYEGVLTPSGFTRFNSVDVSREMCIAHFTVATDELKAVAWLSQANHIFHRVGITASLEDYLLVHYTVFTVNLSYATANMPQGYLFLCPLEDFQVGPSSFRWPDCPGYWSLDPLGIEHLSTDEATCLGFPPVSLTTRIWGRSWDASVYAGIRQFHAAKGFDPDGQEVARHLGYPLYELCSEVDVLFAHVECESFDSVEPPVSRGFKILMNVQLALILFLLLCQAYETVV
ncbi:hypothetical protein C8R46DRAFT_105497 [Mycena filopes]|nr:hypothetical protein C8R46DRAFT_105497 [Mycena filopes]